MDYNRSQLQVRSSEALCMCAASFNHTQLQGKQCLGKLQMYPKFYNIYTYSFVLYIANNIQHYNYIST